MSLYLHCGASRVERSNVESVVTPKPTGQHFPIPHRLLLETVEQQIRTDGLEIVDAAHALTAEGNRYFGLLQVRHPREDRVIDIPSGWSTATPEDGHSRPDRPYDLVIGLRNSHDMRWSAALTVGSVVFVCDNLAFSGEVLVGRKHTRHITRDLPRLVPAAFGALGQERVNQDRRFAAYREHELSDREAHDLIVRAMIDNRCFPPTKLPDVVAQWRKPEHEEFEPRTVWSLFNAFTEVAKVPADKTAALNTLSKRTRALNGFLDKELGLVFQTQQQALESAVSEIAGDEAVTRNDARY